MKIIVLLLCLFFAASGCVTTQGPSTREKLYVAMAEYVATPKGRCPNCDYWFDMTDNQDDPFETIYTCRHCGQKFTKTQAIGCQEKADREFIDKALLYKALSGR